MPDVNLGVQLPGEALAIEILRLIEKVIDGQPPDVKAELWRQYVEDVRAWRQFWGLKP